MDFLELKKQLKKETNSLPSIKIAVLSDFASQFFVQAFRAYGIFENVNYQVFEADYDQIEMQVMAPDSELYAYHPTFVIVLRSSERLLKDFYNTPIENRETFSVRYSDTTEFLYQTITSRLNCKVIVNTYPEINDAVFGNFATKINSSFPYQVKALNLSLMDLSRRVKGLFLADFSSAITQFGLMNSFDPKMFIHADMVFNLNILPELAKNIHDIIQAISGRFKKCLILDLDNTIWGGIIGDDGIEGIQIGDLGLGKAFTIFQRWIKELRRRGIIIAICSKNTEEIAREPFEKHPDMILRMEDISVFVANWENKTDNINYIKNILNISFDSIVFLDDNPFERGMVKKAFPEITVPELPEDPAAYLPFLREQNLFETASLTEEDNERTKQYQAEFKRIIIQQRFANEGEFLESLDMKSEAIPFNEFTIPRIAQLSQRSNQFNLRTIRYTHEEVSNLSISPNYITISFTLEDTFGNHGLVCAIILEKRNQALFIDTWIMSCRVLKRGLEHFVLNTIVETARINGFKQLIGEYIPTVKNGMVKEHYPDLGFSSQGGIYLLNVDDYTNKKTFIKVK